MTIPLGNTNAKGKRWKPRLPKAPWPLRAPDHRGWGGPTFGGYTHGGTVAGREVPLLLKHANGEEAPPLRELVTPVLRPDVAEVFQSLYDEIVSDLGGAEDLSAMAKALIRATTCTILQLQYIDAWIASRPDIINNLRSTLIPIVKQRQGVARTLAMQLNVLGLERRAKNVDTLESYLARAAAAVPATPATDAEVVDDEGPAVTILDAIADPKLFGVLGFNAQSWWAWRVFLSTVFALPLDAAGLAIYRRCTGRELCRRGVPVREAWLPVGRRGGKSRMVALVAVFLACFPHLPARGGRGRRGAGLRRRSDPGGHRAALREGDSGSRADAAPADRAPHARVDRADQRHHHRGHDRQRPRAAWPHRRRRHLG